MGRVLYLDCFSGISGDMLLGACLDAGLPFEALKAALGRLPLSGYEIEARKVLRCGVSATKFDVLEQGRVVGGTHDVPNEAVAHVHPHAHADGSVHTHAHVHPHGSSDAAHAHGHAHDHAGEHRSLADIRALIDRSGLTGDGKARARALFQRLGEAEAAIHQMPIEQVHLHEVGALDSIIDIVGAVFALEWFHADRIVCSPLNVGGGMVQSAHGTFPVPAPATVRLLADAPIYGGRIQKELVTPTGALLATAYADSYGPLPAMVVDAVGYGAGHRDLPDTPNVLRLLVGREAGERERASSRIEKVAVLECEIDDMNPQIFGVVMDRLLAAGALDVYYVPVQMKKNRPGTLLTVVAPPHLRPALADIIFAETTTIGLRLQEVDRERLDREIVAVTTPLGVVRFKLARRDGRLVNAAPEFDDCAKLAASHGRTVKEIQALAVQCFGAAGREDGRAQ